jgi:hypothetical protein
MIFSIVSASDLMAPVQGEQPSDRMRHLTTCVDSPGSSGTKGCSFMISELPRTMTSRSLAKYSGTIGMFSTLMYCQTSSSVQLDSGNTRMLSPVRMRLFRSVQSSGRWCFGSHWPFASRSEKMRSLARDRSSSLRAPPKAASKLPASSASSSDFVLSSPQHRCVPTRKGCVPSVIASSFVWTISRAPISFTYRSRNSIISRNLYVVSTCRSGKGIGPGWNAFCASRSSTDESLPME